MLLEDDYEQLEYQQVSEDKYPVGLLLKKQGLYTRSPLHW